MPAGIGYGKEVKKGKKVKTAGLMRQMRHPKVTKGTHERALNAAFEMARRKKRK